MKSLFKKSLLVLMVAFIAVFTLGVTNKVNAEDGTWTKVTNVSDLAVDDQVVIVANTANYALSTNQKSSNRGAAAVTKSGNTITFGADVQVLTLKAGTTSGSFAFYTGSGYLYAASSSSNHLKTQTTNNANGSWDITITAAGVATIKAKGTNTKNVMQYNPNNGSPLFACYGSASQQAIAIYKFISASSENPTQPTISLAGAEYTQVDETVTLTATTGNTTGVIQWGSSNENVATVDQTGKVTAKAMGETTITASVDDVESKLILKVYPKNDVNITVAEALEICKLSGETNSPYKYSLTAKITSIDDAYSEQYDNITVTVSDETGSIKVFRITGGSELLAGDNITVTGYLVNYYGNTPEFAAGCTYVKHVNESIETIKIALNEIKAYMSLAYKYSVVEPVEGASQVVLAEPEVISFDLGANGSASHNDGTEISAGKTYTSGNYTLKVDNCSKVYGGARDAKGNSCLKFGTSSVVGTLQFTVPEEVTSIVIYVAKYKSNATKVSINGTTYTLTQNSNDGKYDELTIDTSSNKTVKFATVSGSARCMVNQIDYVIESQDPESPTIEYSSEFKIKCGVDASIKNIASLAEGKEFSWGIEVSDGMTEPRYYASNSEYMLNDDNSKMQYVIIDLGDVLNNIARAKKEFTVRAYVEVDGFKYYSSEAKTYSVASIVDVYCGFENLTEEQKGQVNSLNDVLTSLGC